LDDELHRMGGQEMTATDNVLADTEPSSVDQAGAGRSRRLFLTGALAGVGAGAVAGAGTAAAMTADDASTLTVDVACLGPTVRITAAPVLDGAAPALYDEEPLDPSDLAGSPFLAQGIIYPAGTIAGEGFIPTDEGSIGTWLCRGFFINGPQRPDPHMSTDQTFHFGALTFEDGIGNAMLATHGIEGAGGPAWEVNRLVTGGTGEYRGARGECRQTEIGRNSTLFPWGLPALNFRFDFDLVT